LCNAIRIFREHGVLPVVWVAPAHSFDSTTVNVLSKLGVRIISDGYAMHPYQDDDEVTWIPQQVGKFRKLPFGTWTICCHMNEWTDADTERFRRDLRRYRHHFTTVADMVKFYGERRRSWFDLGANRLLDLGLRIARPLRKSLRRSRVNLPDLRSSAPCPLAADDDQHEPQGAHPSKKNQIA
jgi:hypothetical protein